MQDIKKKKSLLFCFYLMLITTVLMSGCGKSEEVSLTEISRQNGDADHSGSEEESSEEDESGGLSEEKEEDLDSGEKSEERSCVYVYMCGRVNQPGVYRLAEGSRICDGIEAAGGMSGDAASDYMNLAALLEDGERVYIPSEEEAKEFLAAGGGIASMQDNQTKSGSDSSGKVNINSAGKEELMTLSGIGASKAEAIIRYRESNGRFDSIEELMQVEGIKEGTFEKIKNDITL